MGHIFSGCIGYLVGCFPSTSIQLVLFLTINNCGKSIVIKNFRHSCIRLGQEIFTHNFVFPITIGIKKFHHMRITTHRIFFGIMMLCFSIITIAQVRPQTAGDSTRPGGPGLGQRPAAGVRPYREIITDKAITKNGFFKVHKVDGCTCIKQYWR